MTKIDEWNRVFPRSEEPSGTARGAGSRPKEVAPAQIDRIYKQLRAMKPRPAMAVHFYLGEGFRWIRVGFDEKAPIDPPVVEHTGRVIESFFDKSEPLFFHALRPHDILFFLEGGDSESMGMPVRYFGTPLEELLLAWKRRAAAKPSRARQ